MGRLVADAGKRDWEELTAEYGAMLMEGVGVMGTRGKHVNVLQHLMGYLKKDLSSEDKAYRRYVGAAGPHRGLPAGAGAGDCAADALEASFESLPGSRCLTGCISRYTYIRTLRNSCCGIMCRRVAEPILQAR
jgi:hypothetical protein